MTVGFLPPSSSATCLNNGAAVVAIDAPVAVPPVNEMVGTRWCATNGAPTFGPNPWTMLNTPAGNPTSVAICPNRCAVDGVNSEGFATAVLPVASAGATFQVNKYSGKFHGDIKPATPRGLRSV